MSWEAAPFWLVQDQAKTDGIVSVAKYDASILVAEYVRFLGHEKAWELIESIAVELSKRDGISETDARDSLRGWPGERSP